MKGFLLPTGAPRATWKTVVAALQDVPELVRLLDAPALFAAACLDAAEAPGREERLERLHRAVATPQRQLASDLRLPSLGILRRLTGPTLTPRRLARLRTLGDDAAALRLLRHVEGGITPLMLWLLANPAARQQTAASLILQLGRNFRRRTRPRSAQIVELVEFLAEYRPGQRLVSLGQARALRHSYRGLLEAHHRLAWNAPALPPPPLADEPGYAVALRTLRMMILESVEMHNCSGWHEPLVAAVCDGREYLYRIEPNWGLPRATMRLVRKGATWRIGEVQRRRNQPLDPVLVRCLAVWVADRQGIADETRCCPANSDAFMPADA